MDTMLKRLLSFAVALVMAIGLMPWNAASVYATETVPEETEAPTEEDPTEAPEVGHVHTCEAHADCTEEWKPWNGTADELVGGGHFYVAEEVLTVNVALDSTHGDVTICLNGKTLQSNGGSRIFTLTGGANLTIVDCTATGTVGTESYQAGEIEFTANTIECGAFVYCDSSTFTMYDGIVEGGGKKCTKSSAENGGLIQVIGNSRAYINGGWLRNYSAYIGAAIYITDMGQVEMTGGYISGCTATARGHAVYVYGGAAGEAPKFTMSGGTINGNGPASGTNGYATVAIQGVAGSTPTAEISGTAVISNNNSYGVHLVNNTSASAFTMNGGTISGNQHNAQGAGVRLDGGTFNMEGGFITGNMNTNKSTPAAGQAAGVLVNNANAVFSMTGGTISGNGYDGEGAMPTGLSQVHALKGSVSLSEDAVINALEDGVVVHCTSGTGTASITGGTYNKDVSAYVAEGYQQLANGSVIMACVEHTPAVSEKVEPTCSQPGKTEGSYCSVCGEILVAQEEIPATGEHSYDDGVETQAPTCGKDGVKTYTCTDCGESYPEAIDATGEHTYDENGLCSVCGARNPEVECEHEYRTECDKICEICGEESRPEADHAEATHVARVEPTCYVDGNLEYWFCEKCGAAWLDEACTLNTNLKAVVLPMAHGEIIHVEAKASTCYEYGNIEYWYCAPCGAAWLDAECTLNTNQQAVKLPLAEAVASIGDKNYESLEAAVAAATEEANTIKVLKDITVSKQIVIEKNVTITADEAVTIAVSDEWVSADGTTIAGNRMIVVKSGKLTINGKSEDAKITIAAGKKTSYNIDTNGGNVELTNVALVGNPETTQTAADATIGLRVTAGEASAKSVTIQNIPKGDGIYVTNGASLDVDDVTIDGTSRYGLAGTGTVNIYNTQDPENALSISNTVNHGIDVKDKGAVISHFENVDADTYLIKLDTTGASGIIVRQATLDVTNISISNATKYGIWVHQKATVSSAKVENAKIENAGECAIRIENNEGSLTVENVTVDTCGEKAVYNLNNIVGNLTYTHNYVDGKCDVCGEAQASITLSAASLNLLDQVCIIYEATDDQIVTNEEIVAERGVLLYASETAAQNKDATQLNETIVLEKNDAGKYVGQSQGIDARDMAESQFAVAYLKLADDTYVYGTNEDGTLQVKEFSPLIYCQKAVADDTISAEAKNLCCALMHYGAAAQVAQYNMTEEEGLMNAGFAAIDYKESVLGETSVFSANTRTTNGMKLKSVTMALKGAISYIVKFTADGVPAGKELHVEYTLEGKTGTTSGTAVLSYDSDGKLLATIDGIAAKDLGAKLTVTPYYMDGENKVEGGTLVFSGYEYTRIVTKNASYNDDVKNLAKALAMYVSYADAYAKTVEGQ